MSMAQMPEILHPAFVLYALSTGQDPITRAEADQAKNSTRPEAGFVNWVREQLHAYMAEHGVPETPLPQYSTLQSMMASPEGEAWLCARVLADTQAEPTETELLSWLAYYIAVDAMRGSEQFNTTTPNRSEMYTRTLAMVLRVRPGVKTFLEQDQTRTAACRHTWERWALGVLGDAEWSWSIAADGPCVGFREGHVTNDDGCYRVLGAKVPLAAFADPVAALVFAALESIRRRV